MPILGLFSPARAAGAAIGYLNLPVVNDFLRSCSRWLHPSEVALADVSLHFRVMFRPPIPPHSGQPQRRAPLRRRPPLPAVRPAGPGGWRRPGRLHAPEAARTGPVGASRSYLSWSPRGRRVNGQNGHFSCQAGRNHVGTPPGRYGSGFNGPRALYALCLPIYDIYLYSGYNPCRLALCVRAVPVVLSTTTPNNTQR